MKIISRYLLTSYFKVLFLSLFSFIAILLVTRIEEIATFAAMGAKPTYLVLFTLFQIPYILPIVLPISCLISSMILFQRLSQTHELMAFRASGISLKKMLSPILLASTFLSFGAFYLNSEIATAAHLATRKMIYDLSSVNPLLLLQNTQFAKLQGAFIQMKPTKQKQAASDIIIAAGQDRLNLCIAKKIERIEDNLKAENVSLITSVSSTPKDHLVIENQQIMSSSLKELSKILKSGGWKIGNDYLKLGLLKSRFRQVSKEIKEEKNAYKRNKLIRVKEKCKTEMVRRFSMAMAVFTFTLMGASFAIEISRKQTKRGLIKILSLSSLSLIAFFTAKEFDHLFLIASLLFIAPHLFISFLSLYALGKVNKGIE